MAARDDALQLSAKRAFNLCPICWMPLSLTGSTEERDRWTAVQVLFKSKPAFSVYDYKEKKHVGRPVNAFGHHYLFGTDSANMQKSHYVHYSFFGKQPRNMGVWMIGSGADAAEFAIDPGNVKGTQGIETRLENGFLTTAMEDSRMNAMLQNRAESGAYNQDAVKQTASAIFNGEFAGCVDCNNKMTIANYVGNIFEMAFYRYYAKARSQNSATLHAEDHLHFIMLTGVLKTGDVFSRDGGYWFGIRPEDTRKKTWMLKYITMWCALQVLFCLWHIGDMSDDVRHHGEYLYMGVMDFYLGLWLFVMHDSQRGDGGDKLHFEEFHFYYTSCYAKSKNYNNLSRYVLRNTGVISKAESLHDTIDQLKSIFSAMRSVWGDHGEFQSFSNSIHVNRLPAFFQPVDVIIQRRNWAERQPLLEIDNFAHARYWFHFKHITFNNIRLACEVADKAIRLPAHSAVVKKAIWRGWYRAFKRACMALAD